MIRPWRARWLTSNKRSFRTGRGADRSGESEIEKARNVAAGINCTFEKKIRECSGDCWRLKHLWPKVGLPAAEGGPVEQAGPESRAV